MRLFRALCATPHLLEADDQSHGSTRRLSPYVNRPRRDQRERAALVLKKSADAQRDLAKHIRINFVKRAEIERVRRKLQRALAALDELQAGDDVVGEEVAT